MICGGAGPKARGSKSPNPSRSSGCDGWRGSRARSVFCSRPANKDAFDSLYRATSPRIFAPLIMILKDRPAAEDATQEAFLRAFRAWKGWNQDAPAEAWMHRIALNVAFTKRRREQFQEVAKLILHFGRPDDPYPTASADPDLRQELRALPPKQAAAIVLRYLHGYSNREIALSPGVPERTVASRLAAAKARLKVRLGDRVEK